MTDVRDPLIDYDRLGRRQPTRLGWPRILRSIPGLLERSRIVPAAAIAEQAHDDEGDYSLVACPCGHRPIVRSSLKKCDGCERYYVAFGASVFVTYGGMEVPRSPTKTSPSE